MPSLYQRNTGIIIVLKQIVAQHSWRNFVKSEKNSKGLKFDMYSENVPSKVEGDTLIPGELYYLTKDKTDYAWYTTR